MSYCDTCEVLDTCSFRIAALQVVCSLALWWVVAGIGDGSRWAVWGGSGGGGIRGVESCEWGSDLVVFALGKVFTNWIICMSPVASICIALKWALEVIKVWKVTSALIPYPFSIFKLKNIWRIFFPWGSP